MASTNIKIFDENKGNMLSDGEYAANAQRLQGVQAGIASSKLQNKSQYQTSLVAYAIAQMMVNNGLDANDSDAVSTFVNNLSETVLQKVLDKATQQEAEDGTNDTKYMTPKTTKQAVNKNLSNYKFSNASYIALINNINAANNEAAFMPSKPNEITNFSFSLGWQIYQYLNALYPEVEITEEQKELLCSQNDWYDICYNAKSVIDLYSGFISKINGIPFAFYVYNNFDNILNEEKFISLVNSTLLSNYTSIEQIMSNPTYISEILNNNALGQAIRKNSALQDIFFGVTGEYLTLLNEGGNFTIPDGVNTLCYGIVTRGQGAGEGMQGFVKVGALSVTPGQNLSYNISSSSPVVTLGTVTVNSETSELLSDENCSFLLRAYGASGRSGAYETTGGGGIFGPGSYSNYTGIGGQGGGGGAGGYGNKGGAGVGGNGGGNEAGQNGATSSGPGGPGGSSPTTISKDSAGYPEIYKQPVLFTQHDKILSKCAKLSIFGGAGGSGGVTNSATAGGAGGGAGHGASGGKRTIGSVGGILTLGGGGGGGNVSVNGGSGSKGGDGASGALGGSVGGYDGSPAPGLIILFWGGQSGLS